MTGAELAWTSLHVIFLPQGSESSLFTWQQLSQHRERRWARCTNTVQDFAYLLLFYWPKQVTCQAIFKRWRNKLYLEKRSNQATLQRDVLIRMKRIIVTLFENSLPHKLIITVLTSENTHKRASLVDRQLSSHLGTHRINEKQYFICPHYTNIPLNVFRLIRSKAR